MKDFDNSLITQISSEEAITFWLLDLKVDTSTTVYFSTLDIEIVYDGNTYLPYEFEIKPINFGGSLSVDKVSIDFANIDLALSAILLNNNIQGNENIIRLGIFEPATYNLPATTNLVGYWAMDDGGGSSVVDSSPEGNDGTLTGTYSWGDGVLGDSLEFTTASGYAYFGTDSSLQLTGDMTYSIWYKPTLTYPSSGAQILLSNETYSASGFLLYITSDTGQIVFRTNQAGATDTVVSTEVLTTETDFIHIVMVKESGVVTFYFDGVEDSGGGAIDDPVTPTIGFYISSNNPYSAYGKIDEVRVYNRALTALEVKALYEVPDGSLMVEEVYRGITNEWGLDENKASISIVSEFVYWNKKTLRKPGALCPWVFKGVECTYSGSETLCNKTYERCEDLSNEEYFGGFRFFPSIEEKEVWWGKTSSGGSGGGIPPWVDTFN